MAKHEIDTICPNCGHRYNPLQHWLVCPKCGHETPKYCEHFEIPVDKGNCDVCHYCIPPEFRLGEKRCIYESVNKPISL